MDVAIVIINKLVRKYGSMVTFIETFDVNVRFKIGHAEYIASYDYTCDQIECEVITADGLHDSECYAAKRMAGILNGLKRDDSGLMVVR
jgi:hypothetical protein